MRHRLRRRRRARGRRGVRQLDDPRDRIDRAERIRDVRDARRASCAVRAAVLAARRAAARRASFIGTTRRYAPFSLAQHLPRHDVGVVLQRGDDDLVARRRTPAPVALRDEIDRLGRAAREDHLVRVRARRGSAATLSRAPRRRRSPARSARGRRGGCSRSRVRSSGCGSITATRLLAGRGVVEIDERLAVHLRGAGSGSRARIAGERVGRMPPARRSPDSRVRLDHRRPSGAGHDASGPRSPEKRASSGLLQLLAHLGDRWSRARRRRTRTSAAGARVRARCRGSSCRTAPSRRSGRPSRRACTSRRRRRSRAAAWCRSAPCRESSSVVVRLLAVGLLRLGWTYTLPLNTPCDAPSRTPLYSSRL